MLMGEGLYMDKVGSIWEISVFSSQLYYKTKTALKNIIGNSLVVQWLELHASTAGVQV